MSYDPNCLHCRRDAGKDAACVTRVCEAHKDAEIARLQREVAVVTENRDNLVKRISIEQEYVTQWGQEVAALRQQLAAEQERADHWMSESQRLLHLLEAERAKRCGQCADWKVSCCLNVNSRCYGLLAIPSDHGCPWFRQREEGR